MSCKSRCRGIWRCHDIPRIFMDIHDHQRISMDMWNPWDPNVCSMLSREIRAPAIQAQAFLKKYAPQPSKPSLFSRKMRPAHPNPRLSREKQALAIKTQDFLKKYAPQPSILGFSLRNTQSTIILLNILTVTAPPNRIRYFSREMRALEAQEGHPHTSCPKSQFLRLSSKTVNEISRLTF